MSLDKAPVPSDDITAIFGTDSTGLQSLLGAVEPPETGRVTRAASKPRSSASEPAHASADSGTVSASDSASRSARPRRNTRRRVRERSPPPTREKTARRGASPESGSRQKRSRRGEDSSLSQEHKSAKSDALQNDSTDAGETSERRKEVKGVGVHRVVSDLRNLGRTEALDSVFPPERLVRPLTFDRVCGCKGGGKLSFMRYLALECELHTQGLTAFANALAANGVDATYETVSDSQWRALLKTHAVSLRMAPHCLDLADFALVLRKVLPSSSVVRADSARAAFAAELYEDTKANTMTVLMSFFQAVCRCYFQLLQVSHPWLKEFRPFAEEVLHGLRDVVAFEITAISCESAPCTKPIVCAVSTSPKLLCLGHLCEHDGVVTDASGAADDQGSDASATARSAAQVQPEGPRIATSVRAESHGLMADVPGLISPYVLDGLSPVQLPTVLFVILHPEQMTRADARAVLTEWFYILLALRLQCESNALVTSSALWTTFEATIEGCIGMVTKLDSFWDLYIPAFAKKTRPSKSFPVLAALFSRDFSFVRESLFPKRTKARDHLVESVVTHFSTFARDPVRLMTSHRYEMDALGFSGDQFALESLFSAVFKHALYLRELVVCRDSRLTNSFIEGIEVLLGRVDRIFKVPVAPAESAVSFARCEKNILPHERDTVVSLDSPKQEPSTLENGLASRSRKDGAAKSFRRATLGMESDNEGNSGDEVDSPRVFQETRLLCFVAKFVGFWCKSFQDGSWNPEHVCLLSTMMDSAKWKGSRQAGALYLRLVSLQRSLATGSTETDSGIRKPLISIDECNHFMFVVEAVRQRLLAAHDERAATQGELTDAGLSSGKEQNDTKGSERLQSLRLPNIVNLWSTKDIRGSDFESQGDVMLSLSTHSNAVGHDMLCRFDPSCNTPAKFVRLRRNRYICPKPKGRAAHVCSCLPIGVGSQGVGSTSRIACSNELCENRGNMIECDQSTCPAGGNCRNQRLQKLQYSKVVRRDHGSKGSGLHAGEAIQPDGLIGEYQGEIVDLAEFAMRREEYLGERHFYFMKLGYGLFIDASRYAQITRFINHSCEPNAMTQKWTAGRESRVAIVAKRLIERDEEITFDYGTEEGTAVHERPVRCSCGAKNCRGFLVRVSKKEKVEGKEGLDRSPGNSPIDTESYAAKEAETRKLRIAQAKKFIDLSEEFRAAHKKCLESEPPPKKPLVSLDVLLNIKRGGASSWGNFRRVVDTTPKVDDSFRIPRKFADTGIISGNANGDALIAALSGSASNDGGALGIKMELPDTERGMNASGKKYQGRERKSFFAPAGAPMRKFRRSDGQRAPILRNRKHSPSQLPIDSDSDSSCGEYSITSPTVPVGDDAVFVLGLSPDNRECTLMPSAGTPSAMNIDS